MIQDKDLSVIDTLPVKEGGLKGFLDAATVWINKPHVANKRLSGTKIVQITSAESLNSADEILAQFLSNRSQNSTSDGDKTCNLEADLKENEEKIVIIFRLLLPKQLKLFPVLLEAVVCDQSSQSVTFLPLCYSTRPDNDGNSDECNVSSEVAYCFTFLQQNDGNSGAIQLSCKPPPQQQQQQKTGGEGEKKPHHAHATLSWLRDTLTPKMQRWTEQSNLSTAIKSLRLVGVDRYSSLYSELKDKYGPQLVKNWTESTDPQKFVYEDIGIAAYLLLIWEEDRQRADTSRKQSFVDLGCGNGLLVYILSMEGHPGLGIDLRKRKIWDTFGSDVKLQERSITPSGDNLFPDFDWLIGNHSDELTPWIPVIAARSSYSCSYFVLPCCLHDFNCRFNSKAKGESNYRSYLTYVGQVGQACGFRVEEDTLRIPSTKRVCHIGRHRTYPQDQETAADQQRQEFIDQRCALSSARKANDPHVDEPSDTDYQALSSRTHLKRPCGGSDSRDSPERAVSDKEDGESRSASHDERVDDGKDDSEEGGRDKTRVWTESFQARSGKESVRNCQTVSQATKDHVVRGVFQAVMAAEDASEVEGQEGGTWRRGGSLHLSAVADMLDAAMREDLKSECGGVQTLLRNHSNVFQVSGGRVRLRDFSQADPWSPHSRARKARRADDPSTWKISPCWFHANHPDGCPRTTHSCSFAHGEAELRPRVVKTKR